MFHFPGPIRNIRQYIYIYTMYIYIYVSTYINIINWYKLGFFIATDLVPALLINAKQRVQQRDAQRHMPLQQLRQFHARIRAHEPNWDRWDRGSGGSRTRSNWKGCFLDDFRWFKWLTPWWFYKYLFAMWLFVCWFHFIDSIIVCNSVYIYK